MILKYLILRITFTFEILRAFINLTAAYFLNFLPDSITHFWTSFNTFTSADLQGQSFLVNKLFLVIQQIIDVFLGIGNGNYFAVQLLVEVAILARIYGYFLSRIVKNRNNIKITRLKDVIYSLIGYSFLFLITINAQPILSTISAWFQR